jgi:hypothetical protein
MLESRSVTAFGGRNHAISRARGDSCVETGQEQLQFIFTSLIIVTKADIVLPNLPSARRK